MNEMIEPNENPALDVIDNEIRSFGARVDARTADHASGVQFSDAEMKAWVADAERIVGLIIDRARITGEPLGPDHAARTRSLEVLRRLADT